MFREFLELQRTPSCNTNENEAEKKKLVYGLNTLGRRTTEHKFGDNLGGGEKITQNTADLSL